ncbi:unnamed protein product, partial [Ixodes hexagonus]
RGLAAPALESPSGGPRPRVVGHPGPGPPVPLAVCRAGRGGQLLTESLQLQAQLVVAVLQLLRRTPGIDKSLVEYLLAVFVVQERLPRLQTRARADDTRPTHPLLEVGDALELLLLALAEPVKLAVPLREFLQLQLQPTVVL